MHTLALSAALEVSTASCPLQVRRPKRLEVDTEFGRWECRVPIYSPRLEGVLRSTWCPGSKLSPACLDALHFPAPLISRRSLPASRAWYPLSLAPSGPASGFPELFVFNEGPLLLKSSLVCLLEGRGFPKGKLWVRPFNKATRKRHGWPFEASRGMADMGVFCSIVDSLVQPGQRAGTWRLGLILETSSPFSGKACCCSRHCRLL